MRYPNGDVFEGKFNRMREGVGTYTYADGSVYEGGWQDGLHHGKGTKRFPNGDVYEGDFQSDKRHGKGTYTYASGNVYQGEWKEGEKEGKKGGESTGDVTVEMLVRSEGTLSLATAIEKYHPVPLTAIHGICALFWARPENAPIKLDLSKRNIGTDGLAALARAMSPTVTSLKLEDTDCAYSGFDYSGIEQLCAALETWPLRKTVPAVLTLIVGKVGLMSVCLHRYAAHGAFKCGPVTNACLCFFGCLSNQGGPIWWGSKHRCHHSRCDKEDDPHSPAMAGVTSLSASRPPATKSVDPARKCVAMIAGSRRPMEVPSRIDR